MTRSSSFVPFAAVCGALLCVSLPSAGRLSPSRGTASAAAPNPGHGQEALGAVVTSVERSGGVRAVRMPGRVALDETRLYRINAGMSGSIRDVPPIVTGSRVRKDQVLGSFYGYEQIEPVQLFIMNTHGFDPAENAGRTSNASQQASRARGSLAQANIQQRTQELENMGVTASQRAEIARTGQIPDTIWIVAPAGGVVLERNVSPGLKFDRGYALYTIADLRRVWVVADVFPQDARYVHPGVRAEVSIPEQGIAVAATIDRILPEVDPDARTMKVRLAVENPGEALLPGMFVSVRLDVDLPPAAVVPSDAVVDAGASELVWVRSAAGGVEARAVTTGWRSGDRVEIVDGLAPGDQVVTAGAFLFDSETRLRAPGGAAGALALEAL